MSFPFPSTLFQVAKSYESTAWQSDSSNTTLLYFHFHAKQVWIFNICCWGITSQAIVRGICFLTKYSSWKKLQFVHDFKRNICYIIFDVFSRVANCVFACIVNESLRFVCF